MLSLLVWGMVKGEREDDKFMSPMFPRLHVNDTDKGGPRAPPRNKMALYEQLSIPSHRFHSTAASVLPLPPHNASTLISSASSQGCGHERSVLSPCYVPPNAPGKVHSHSSNGKISAAAIREFKRPVRHGDQGSSYAAYSIADCNLLHPHDAYDSKNSCDEDDDFRVPTFVYSEFAKCSSKNMPAKETKKSSASGRKKSAESYSCTINSSAQLPNSYDKPLEQKSAGVVTARKHKRNHSEQMFEETIGTVEFAFHPDNGGKLAEPSTYSKASLDHECTRIRNAIEKTCPANTEKSQESFVNGCPGELECLDSRDVTEDSDARLRSGCSSKSSPRSSLKDPNVADNCYQKLGDKASVSLELGDGDRNGEMSDTMVDSMVGLNISPDDVVGVIGSKQFWTARTAITKC